MQRLEELAHHLDEPTNHLDGGFSTYLSQKDAARHQWERAFEAQREELNALRAQASTTARQVAHDRAPRDRDKFIYHFKGGNVQAAISRRVRDAEHRIEVIERSPIPKPPRPLTFDAPRTAGRKPGGSVALRDVVVDGRLQVPRLDLASGEHLLVTGPNGSGKSTLLRLLAGDLTATTGTVEVLATRIGFLPQDVYFQRPERTPRQLYTDMTASPIALGDLGLLHPRDLSRPVGILSTGQQRRLALAVVIARQPDLVLLDEPTNHISLTLASELEAALTRTQDSVIIASHDRWLGERWNGRTQALTVSVPGAHD